MFQYLPYLYTLPRFAEAYVSSLPYRHSVCFLRCFQCCIFRAELSRFWICFVVVADLPLSPSLQLV